MPPQNFLDNPFIRFLEEGIPEAFVFANLPQRPSPAQQQFASGIFQPLLQRFQGETARRAISGQGFGDLTFPDFLRQNFNFGRQFRRFGAQPGQGITGPIRRVF